MPNVQLQIIEAVPTTRAFPRDVLLVILGVALTAIITLVLLYVDKHFDFSIAKKSGAFRAPKLVLELFSQRLDPQMPLKTPWCIIHPGTGTDVALFPFLFGVVNEGDATCEGAVLTIQVPSMCCLDSPKAAHLRFAVVPKLYKRAFKRTVDIVGDYAILAYALPPISPNGMVSLQDWFLIMPTVLPFSFDTQSTKGTNWHVSTQLMFRMRFAITLLVKDSSPSQLTLEIESIPANSLDEGVQRYRLAYIEDRDKSQPTPFLQRLRSYIAKRAEIVTFLAMDVEASHAEGAQTLYIMKDLASKGKASLRAVVVERAGD